MGGNVTKLGRENIYSQMIQLIGQHRYDTEADMVMVIDIDMAMECFVHFLFFFLNIWIKSALVSTLTNVRVQH